MKKKPVKKKAVRKPVRVMMPVMTKEMRPLAETADEEIIMDLDQLVNSNGWRRLQQVIEERKLNIWNNRLEHEDFSDIHAFNRVRDQRNIYKDLLSLPEVCIRLIKENQPHQNEDPYV